MSDATIKHSKSNALRTGSRTRITSTAPVPKVMRGGFGMGGTRDLRGGCPDHSVACSLQPRRVLKFSPGRVRRKKRSFRLHASTLGNDVCVWDLHLLAGGGAQNISLVTVTRVNKRVEPTLTRAGCGAAPSWRRCTVLCRGRSG